MIRSLLSTGARRLANNTLTVPVSFLNPASNTLIIAPLCARFVSLKTAVPPPWGTMHEVKVEIMKRLGIEVGYQPIPKTREHLRKYEPKLEDLPTRTMRDSLTSAIIPLSTDKHLHEKYVSYQGTVRVGRLMEDMDLFAVWVCHQHVHIPNLPEDIPLPYTFVTILVDKVNISDYNTKATEDIRLVGHVTWIGRSSIEIEVTLEQQQHGTYKQITQALFLMAARNSTNTGALAVNPLQPANEDEKAILEEAVQRKKRRQLLHAQSIFKVEPNDYEQSLMYELYKRTTPVNTMDLNKRILPGNCRWMTDTETVNTMMSYPEHRNAHNKVFGGFLMRCAVEISWLAALLYSNSRVKVRHISDISFAKPVSVNSILQIKSYVIYSEVNFLQLMTTVDAVDSLSGENVTSNVLYVTLECQDVVFEVLPRSYHETMWYIQGRRKFRWAMNVDE